MNVAKIVKGGLKISLVVSGVFTGATAFIEREAIVNGLKKIVSKKAPIAENIPIEN